MKFLKYFMLFFIITACMNRRSPGKTGLEGKPLPQFNVLLMDSLTNFNTRNIPSKKPVVVFLFSPYCPYCKAQTRDLVEHISSLKDIHFYMLSNSSFNAVKKYCADFKLESYTNITVARDTGLFYAHYIGATGIPYFAIYGKDKRLKQGLLGQIEIDKIKNIAFE